MNTQTIFGLLLLLVTIFVIVYLAATWYYKPLNLLFGKTEVTKGLGPDTKKKITTYVGGPLNRVTFNHFFVSANQTLKGGDTQALRDGIANLIDALQYSGDYAQDLVPAIDYLRCALSYHDRADTHGPWNRDLSGYGVMSWKSDLLSRQAALEKAWPHILAIDQDLKKHGLGVSWGG